MSETAQFHQFLTFYEAVLNSAALTVAEKTQLIEAAGEEWVIRSHKPAFDTVVRRLIHAPERAAKGTQEAAAVQEPKRAPADGRSPTGRFLPRSNR